MYPHYMELPPIRSQTGSAVPSSPTKPAPWQLIPDTSTPIQNNTMLASLSAISKVSNERIISFSSGQEVDIKRASSNNENRAPKVTNLYFLEKHMSKQHANICYTALRQFEIKDTNSTFGTILNNRLLIPGRRYKLVDGDTLGFIIKQPSTKISEVIGKFPTDNMIPLSEFENPSIGLVFRVRIHSNVLKFVPLEENKVASKSPEPYINTTTSSITCKEEPIDFEFNHSPVCYGSGRISKETSVISLDSDSDGYVQKEDYNKDHASDHASYDESSDNVSVVSMIIASDEDVIELPEYNVNAQNANQEQGKESIVLSEPLSSESRLKDLEPEGDKDSVSVAANKVVKEDVTTKEENNSEQDDDQIEEDAEAEKKEDQVEEDVEEENEVQHKSDKMNVLLEEMEESYVVFDGNQSENEDCEKVETKIANVIVEGETIEDEYKDTYDEAQHEQGIDDREEEDDDEDVEEDYEPEEPEEPEEPKEEEDDEEEDDDDEEEEENGEKLPSISKVGILEIFGDEVEEEEEEDDDEDDDEEEEEVYEYDLLEQDDQDNEDEYDLLEEEDSESEDNGDDDESVVLQNIQICLTQDMIKCDQNSEKSESNVTSCNIPTVSYTPSCLARKRNHQEIEENKDNEPVVEEPPTKKKRSSVIKTIAKEVGKGLFYAIATITALGIYGHSLERQDQSD